MTGLQAVVVAGIITGLGLWLAVAQLVPAHPNLAQALALLGRPTAPVPPPPASDWRERVGRWVGPHLPEGLRLVPRADLTLIGLTEGGLIGRKLTYALVGLVIPPLLAWLALWLRLSVPLVVPAVASLALGLGLAFLPDVQARAKALQCRREFARALAAYVDLVALERSCGAGTKAALEHAADIGDSWVFRLLRERLHQASWAGQPPWDGLGDMATELALPDLADLADILRLTGTQGAGVYTILRARAGSMRVALMTTELAAANEANEKMSVPMSVLGAVFLAILIGPALMSMMST